MPNSSADRNLLYGVLALQMGFLPQQSLVEAMHSWALLREKPFSEHLIELGAITPEQHAAINAEVDGVIANHNGSGSALDSMGFAMDSSFGSVKESIGVTEISDSLAARDTQVGGSPEPELDATRVWTRPRQEGLSLRSARKLSPRDGARFRIIMPHAKGGLGEVFLARDDELDRDVALKEIRKEHAHNQRSRERFIREAEINGNLEHPAIVPVYGLGVHADGRPFYAMRFVDGETLQDALDRLRVDTESLDVDGWAAAIRPFLRRFLAVCDAIEYAHNRGVLHRDIKPANILLAKFGETVIIDWGLAKVIGTPDDLTVPEPEREPIWSPREGDMLSTIDGETLGSPPYMSPEQARGSHDELDKRSDVYSLGATLYALMTGRSPIVGGSVKQALDRVARGAIDPPGKVNSRVHPALAAICSKAMSLAPADRYESARALGDDLERWLGDLPIAVYRDPISTRLLRWSRAHRSLLAASLAILLSTMVGLAIIAAVVAFQKAKVEAAERSAVLAARLTQQSLDKEMIARESARKRLRFGLEVVDQLVDFGDRELIASMPAADRDRMLRAAESFIHKYQEDEPDDASIKAKTAQISRRLANFYRLTGRLGMAEPLYQEAVGGFEGLVEITRDLEQRDLLAETLIDQADAMITMGKLRAAETMALRACDLSRENLKANPRRDAYHRTLGRGLSRLAATQSQLGKPDAAASARDGLKEITPIADASLPGLRAALLNQLILPLTDQLDWVQLNYTLAEGLLLTKKTDEAEKHLRECLARLTEVETQLQGVAIAELDFFPAWVSTRLARVLAGGPKAAEAVPGLDDAIRRLERLAKTNREIPHFRSALAEAYIVRAGVRKSLSKPGEAEADGELAKNVLSESANLFGEIPEFASLMAEIDALLCDLALKGGAEKRPRAQVLIGEAVELQERAVKSCPDNPAYVEKLESYRSMQKQVGAPGAP